MTRLVLVWLTLVLSILFSVYRPEGKIGFLYSDVILAADTWVYFLFEHLILVILALVIWELDSEYRIAAMTFLCIQIVDTVDYVLTYGEPWWKGPLTWNSIKVFAYGIAFVAEVKKHHGP